MNASEQGTREIGGGRTLVVPRVLIFLTSTNPVTGKRELSLLKGAPTKRLWANRYNGLGGHVEPGEDVYAAAVRKVGEEAGIEVQALPLRGVVTIDTGFDEYGRLQSPISNLQSRKHLRLEIGDSRKEEVRLAWSASCRRGRATCAIIPMCTIW